MRKPSGIFVGLTTLDIIYKVRELPRADEKINAIAQCIAAGGPVTNAAVTFVHLGGDATIVSAVGRHATGTIVRSELAGRTLQLRDLLPESDAPLPFSSVLIKEATGERSVVSVNAQHAQAEHFTAPEMLDAADVLLVDGHQMEAGIEACAHARKRNIPCVMDAGSWRVGTERLLPLIDYVICSAHFIPPGCSSHREVISFLSNIGVKRIAISRGAEPILVADYGTESEIAVTPPPRVVDTVGAGDVLHGAFCYYLISSNGDFLSSLTRASRLASYSCGFFGTREWMRGYYSSF